MTEEAKRTSVRERYGAIARGGSSCCGGGSSCCGSSSAEAVSERIGYSVDEMTSVPEGANLGLGCGNPTALASIRDGETVVDLGSGAGFDCFLAAGRVGPTGRVIGVDMTAEMISRARSNARKSGVENVEFRLGEIEHLPIADGTADLVISNCVINLSPDKSAVFAEAFRVLKPGGRLCVSDIVLDGELPDALRENAQAYSACVCGAVGKELYLEMIRTAGFDRIRIESEAPFGADLVGACGDGEIGLGEGVVMSASISAVRP